MKKGEKTKTPPETRWVPGYVGKYGVTFEGVVYRFWQSGASPMIPTIKRGCPVVRLQRENGTRQEMLIAKAVQLAWLGPTPIGKVRYHKNGDKTDNAAGNIGFITREELGKQTGAMSRRRPVAKFKNGTAIAFYSSAREAAKANHMSYQTVIDRCNGRVKNALALDGCNYQWDDEKTPLPTKSKGVNIA